MVVGDRRSVRSIQPVIARMSLRLEVLMTFWQYHIQQNAYDVLHTHKCTLTVLFCTHTMPPCKNAALANLRPSKATMHMQLQCLGDA